MGERMLERLNTTDYSEVYEMTDHDWGTVKKAFNIFADYDGQKDANYMSADSLPLALRAMKLIPSEKQIEDYISRFFKDPVGIDENTFNVISKECWIDEIGIENVVWNAFAVFDKAQVGKITPEVMRDILLKYGEPIPEDEAEFILKKSVNKENLILYPMLISQWKKLNVFPKPKNKGKKAKAEDKKAKK